MRNYRSSQGGLMKRRTFLKLSSAFGGSLAVWPLRRAAGEASDASIEIGPLRCEFMIMPLGIEDTAPGLSWTIQDTRRGAVQTSYRVLVASTAQLLAQGKGDLWDSGDVASGRSHLVPYNGRTLVSRQRCHWKVQVKTVSSEGKRVLSSWSEPTWWEMGLLRPSDWHGSWIQSGACTPVDDETTRLWTRQTLIPQEFNSPVVKQNPNLVEPVRAEQQRLLGSVLPVPVFRRRFTVSGTVKRARLYISGLGFAEAYVNGKPVSDRMFEPSVTLYQKRGAYVTHDVTDLVHSGDNVVTANVGGGWWHETVVWGAPERFMGKPSLRAQLEVETADGETSIVPTASDWTTTVGPSLKSHYFAGEAHDARRAPGWKSGADDGATWVPATEIKPPVPRLVAQRCEPERVIRRFRPVAVTQPRPGIWVFDMGQMVMGTVELKVKAPAGKPIVLRTAEWTWQPQQQGLQFEKILSHLHYDEGDNSVFTKGMIVGKPRGSTYFTYAFHLDGVTPRQIHMGVPTLVYVPRGDAAGETWRPAFTTHPFRYVEVQGLTEPPWLDLVTGLLISNDEEQVGYFTSGNKRFNDIWEACMNSTRFTTHGMTWDNAVERLQGQVYNSWSAPFASYALWYPNLWRKILEDERLGDVINQPPNDEAFGTQIYGWRGRFDFPPPNLVVTQAVTVELPMQYHDRYGDPREVLFHYPHMKAWIDSLYPIADGELRKSANMGGWEDHFYAEAADDGPWTPEWDRVAMMQMMLYGYTRATASAARIAGHEADSKRFNALAETIRAKVNATWYNPATNTYGAAKNRQTKVVDASTGWHGLMAMAITQGIAPEADVPAILQQCIADMKQHYSGHYAAGHITHQLLYDAYSDHGLIETCYDMMNSTTYPSFAWMLQSGNRTVPEGPSTIPWLPAKASAYQNECQEPARWFTETLCGITPSREAPGFKHVVLRPRIPARLASASLVTMTPYGRLESGWTQEPNRVTWTVVIPANSTATAFIPTQKPAGVAESGRPLSASTGCIVHHTTANALECELAAGRYTFEFVPPANLPSQLKESA